MKRILVLLLSSLLLCGTVLAEPQTIDLETMTFEELAELSRQVQLAIFESDGWQEVTVPIGIYEIGVDIPAGKWTLTATEYTALYYGKSVNEYNTRTKDPIASESLREGESLTWNFIEGTYLEVSSSSVVFTPYVSTSLGFK